MQGDRRDIISWWVLHRFAYLESLITSFDEAGADTVSNLFRIPGHRRWTRTLRQYMQVREGGRRCQYGCFFSKVGY